MTPGLKEHSIASIDCCGLYYIILITPHYTSIVIAIHWINNNTLNLTIWIKS